MLAIVRHLPLARTRVGKSITTLMAPARPAGEQYPQWLDRPWPPRIRGGLRLVGQERISVRQVRRLHDVHDRSLRRGQRLAARGQARGLHLARRHELQVLVRPDHEVRYRAPGLRPGLSFAAAPLAIQASWRRSRMSPAKIRIFTT